MALHPFQSFRKHQKKLLAVLTIFVMFIFILSYGKGDAFDWLARKFGGGRQKDKTEVTTLYGEKVTLGDLDDLAQRRLMTNTFTSRAVAAGTQPDLSDLGPEVNARVRTILQRIQ